MTSLLLAVLVACTCPGFAQPYQLPWLPLGTPLPATWGDTPIPDGHWCLDGNVTIEWRRVPPPLIPTVIGHYNLPPGTNHLHMDNGVPRYPCLENAEPPPKPNEIFADGFESGDLSKWKDPP